MIEEYTKYFIYKDNTFMSVKPGKDYPSGYYDHVRKYDYKVDHINKIILFTNKEIEEIEQIKNNLGGENMNINKERYFKSMNPGHKDFIIINGDKATIKYLEGSKVWKVKENDIIKDLGHKNENAYIKHLKKFNYVEVKEPIKEEFYNNNEVEEGKEMQSKEIKELEKKYNVDIKFREFKGKLMYSVFYSPLRNNVTGIFKDIKQLEKQCKSVIIDNRISLTNKINKLENEYLRNI